MKDASTMAQYLIWVMEGRGKMSLSDIYKEVEKSCKQHGRELPTKSDAEVRRTLQACCPTSRQHNGCDDFFVWHERGYWSCKVQSPSLDDLA
jgi:hypothetical protein